MSRAEGGFEAWWRNYLVQKFNEPDPIRAIPTASQAAEDAWLACEAQSRAAVEAAEREGVLKIIRIVEDWCRSHSGETVHLGMLRVAMAELREVAESLAARSGQEVGGG